ncbi:MAG: MmgE/PrpD family protein [Rhodospirillales bacterium]|nr:MmgE/PrpD family protein [Rhodospirillales bacterium]
MSEHPSRQPALPADGFTRDVCRTLAAVRYEDLPREVVERVKLFLLDTLGVLAGGAKAPGIDILIRRLTAWESQGTATILVGKKKVSPPTAALANGAAAHALDFDDQHDPARIHSYCVIAPAVLAAAEDKGDVGGRELITAIAVGVELHARLGLACPGSIGRGWLPTVAMGTLAGAVGAARLLGLDGDGCTNALGVAYHQAGGNIQARDDQALSKRLGPGFAARSGVLAAFLAKDGITGATRALEGKGGVFRLFERGEVSPDEVTKGLGTDWRVLEFSLKPYPSCRCNHTVISMGLELRAEGIRLDNIEHLEIRLGRDNYEAVFGPYQVERAAQVHGQFNACYNLARALTDGRVDLQSFQPAALKDPNVAALARRMETVLDPELPEKAPAPARLRVKLKDGRTIDRRKDTMIGSPAEPLTEKDVLEKFASCLAFGLGASKTAIDRLAEAALNLEKMNDVSALIQAFPNVER